MPADERVPQSYWKAPQGTILPINEERRHTQFRELLRRRDVCGWVGMDAWEARVSVSSKRATPPDHTTLEVMLDILWIRTFTLCCSRFRCIVLAVSSWTCWMVISSLRATSALYNQAPIVPRGAGRDLSSCVCQSKSWKTKVEKWNYPSCKRQFLKFCHKILKPT